MLSVDIFGDPRTQESLKESMRREKHNALR